MIIVNGSELLTIITKHSILDVAAALDPPLDILFHYEIESPTTSPIRKCGSFLPFFSSFLQRSLQHLNDFLKVVTKELVVNIL